MNSEEQCCHSPAVSLQSQSNLENLIPLAVTIACGCEPCAESAVVRALDQGCSKSDIERALRIIRHVSRMACLLQNAGAEVVARMQRPLAAASEKLREAVESAE